LPGRVAQQGFQPFQYLKARFFAGDELPLMKAVCIMQQSLKLGQNNVLTELIDLDVTAISELIIGC